MSDCGTSPPAAQRAAYTYFSCTAECAAVGQRANLRADIQLRSRCDACVLFPGYFHSQIEQIRVARRQWRHQQCILRTHPHLGSAPGGRRQRWPPLRAPQPLAAPTCTAGAASQARTCFMLTVPRSCDVQDCSAPTSQPATPHQPPSPDSQQQILQNCDSASAPDVLRLLADHTQQANSHFGREFLDANDASDMIPT